MKKVTTALWIAKSLAEQFFRNSAAFRELAPINPPFKSSRGATICGRTAGSGGWAQGPAGRSENARGPTGSGVGGTLEGRNGIRRSTRVCVQLLSRCTRCSSLRIAGVSPAAPIYAVPPPPLPRRRPYPHPGGPSHHRAAPLSSHADPAGASGAFLLAAIGGCVGHSGLPQSRTRSACPHDRVASRCVALRRIHV
jgi:hypothetical protein